MKKSILKSEGFLSFMSSLVSILCGLLIGYILLWVFNPKFANFGLKNLPQAFPPRKSWLRSISGRSLNYDRPIGGLCL